MYQNCFKSVQQKAFYLFKYSISGYLINSELDSVSITNVDIALKDITKQKGINSYSSDKNNQSSNH